MFRISFHRGPLGMYAKIRGNIPKYSRLGMFVSRPPWQVCEVQSIVRGLPRHVCED
ncbi:hypothetical protein HanRHA438_Chr08g0361231 [Helianthus annuus]|nr:hypothetical protein HanRHA438_Chr08g0361231 [Helianthus annuus]